MALRYEWDSAKAATNLKKHGVSFGEATTVFADPLASTFPDPRHSIGEERLVTFGLSHRRQLLAVMHTHTAQQRTEENGTVVEVIRIIGVRPATRTERLAYEEKL